VKNQSEESDNKQNAIKFAAPPPKLTDSDLLDWLSNTVMAEVRFEMDTFWTVDIRGFTKPVKFGGHTVREALTKAAEWHIPWMQDFTELQRRRTGAAGLSTSGGSRNL
jgi:hypothetical protein